MFEVRLDRGYYSKSDAIFRHLRETLNKPDDEWYTAWDGHEGSEDSLYTVQQMFGYTTIKFVNEEDKNRFEKWVLEL